MNSPEEGCHRGLHGDVRVQPGSATTLHLWRYPVRWIFHGLTAFYRLATALHAPGIEENLRRYPPIERGRRPDDLKDWRDTVHSPLWRRPGHLLTWADLGVLDRLRERLKAPRTSDVQMGRRGERFEGVEAAMFLQGEVAELKARTASLKELATTAQRGLEDVARMIRECRE